MEEDLNENPVGWMDVVRPDPSNLDPTPAIIGVRHGAANLASVQWGLGLRLPAAAAWPVVREREKAIGWISDGRAEDGNATAAGEWPVWQLLELVPKLL